MNLDIEQTLFRSNATSGLGVNVFQVDPLHQKHIEIDLANNIFTDNQGVLPSGTSLEAASPFHYTVDSQYANGWIRLSHLTVTGNNAPYAIAVYDTSDPSHTSVAMLGDQSFIENSVLRDNGAANSTVDSSFFPEPGTPRWTKIFKNTHFSDLEATGVSLPAYYTTDNENFYAEPDFRPYTYLGIDLGTVFPATGNAMILPHSVDTLFKQLSLPGARFQS